MKEFTGIDPFTINQEILTEHYLQEKENPYFLLVDALKEVTVFVDDVFSSQTNFLNMQLLLVYEKIILVC